MTGRRSYGTGELYVRTDAHGRETWYGRWYSGSRRIKRVIGPKRGTGSRTGLTRPQAEREMRRRIESEQPSPTRSDVTVADAGDRLVSHLEALGRKPSTLSTYRSLLTVHLKPRLGGDPIARVTIDQVEQLIAAMRADGKSPKLIRNALTLLYQVFEFGQRKGWCQSNPVKSVDRPQLEESTDIHFLEIEEVEALLRAVPEDDPLGPTDRVLYLTAAPPDSGRGNCWPCAGAMSTGLPAGFG